MPEKEKFHTHTYLLPSSKSMTEYMGYVWEERYAWQRRVKSSSFLSSRKKNAGKTGTSRRQDKKDIFFYPSGWNPILFWSLVFLHVFQTEATFVLDYLFNDVCMVHSFRRQVRIFLQDKGQRCLLSRVIKIMSSPGQSLHSHASSFP